MKYTLRKKYILVGSFLILGFLCILLGTSRILKEGLVEKWNRDKMENLAEETVNLLEKENWNISQKNLDILAFENNAYVTVTDEEQKILMTTRNWEAQRGILGKKTKRILQTSAEELKEKGNSFSSDFDDNNRASFMHTTKIPGKGYVIIRKSITGLNSSTRVMEICFIIAALITLLCGIPVIVYFSGRLARPIMEINQVTRQIACLNFEEKASVKSEDELGMLAESVNQMSDKLKETLESLKEDVELRKTLVRNLAHELKTPVAVIMGYAENMSYISRNHPEKQEKYIQVIAAECERMDELIHQMLEVSSYEHGETILRWSSFYPEQLLKKIQKLCQDENPDWRGTFHLECSIQGKIEGDCEILHRALYNLVKNAIYYGKEDGEIRMEAFLKQGKVHFLVHNQGRHIPREEQEKIWDVFYKINPARTREHQSFGIGLSIVRQVALAHHGEVSVRNTSDGVEFQISYPWEEK